MKKLVNDWIILAEKDIKTASVIIKEKITDELNKKVSE
jgi:hypothetical protein